MLAVSFQVNSAHTVALMELEKSQQNIKRAYTNFGLWNETTLITHHIDTKNTDNHFWGSSLFANHPDASGVEQVVVVGICHFLKSEEVLSIDNVLVKLDCEGAELPVMHGTCSFANSSTFYRFMRPSQYE